MACFSWREFGGGGLSVARGGWCVSVIEHFFVETRCHHLLLHGKPPPRMCARMQGRLSECHPNSVVRGGGGQTRLRLYSLRLVSNPTLAIAMEPSKTGRIDRSRSWDCGHRVIYCDPPPSSPQGSLRYLNTTIIITVFMETMVMVDLEKYM